MATSVLDFFPDTDTINVRPVATFLERAQRVWGINEFLKPLRNHRSVKGTELQGDVANFNALVRTHAVLLMHLHCSAESTEYAYAFLALNSHDRVEQQIRNFSIIHRFSFTAMGNFFLEHIHRELVAGFGEKPQTRFYRLSEQAVRLAKLPDGKEHIDALSVTSKLRNAFHNRGIHHGFKEADETIVVRGVTYQFNDKDIVRGYASWDYICHGFACALITIR